MNKTYLKVEDKIFAGVEVLDRKLDDRFGDQLDWFFEKFDQVDEEDAILMLVLIAIGLAVWILVLVKSGGC